MPRIVLLLSICVLVVFLAAPAMGDELGQNAGGSHREMNVLVTKIASGFVFTMPFEGLRPRAISPSKADRTGLHETQPGDVVTLIVDEGNVLVDAHKAGMPSDSHRHITGTLNYADTFWREIKLSTPDGIEQFDVDTMAGSKLSVLSEGVPVIVEIDEDNMLIDIHRVR